MLYFFLWEVQLSDPDTGQQVLNKISEIFM